MKSRSGFIFSFIGGIINILISLIFVILVLLVFLTTITLSAALTKRSDLTGLSMLVIVLFIIGLIYFFIIGILGIVFSFKINNETQVLKGSIWCLILGVLTLNIFLIIGSILGFKSSRKLILNQNSTSNIPINKSSSKPTSNSNEEIYLNNS